MKKYAGIIFFMMISLILSGCELAVQDGEKDNQVSANKTPDTRAFNDEFTKEFMDSPKDIENGYYLFRSKTNGYTMLFPVEGKVSDFGYERNKDFYEKLYIGEATKEKNISYNISLTYEEREVTNDIDSNIYLLSTIGKYDGEFKKIEDK
ncbi:MAG TPA: hypothetical protein VIG80_12275, partial [Bacillaceae bacterium]